MLFGVEGECTIGFSNNGGSGLLFEGGVERETGLGRLLGLCLWSKKILHLLSLRAAYFFFIFVFSVTEPPAANTERTKLV